MASIVPLYGRAYCAETRAYLRALTTPAPRWLEREIDRLIRDLIRCGAWRLLDLLYLFWVHDQSAALINLKSPGTFTLTISGTPTFTALRGFTGNGTDGSLVTGYKPTAQTGGQYQLNTSTLGVWSLSDATANGSYMIGSASQTTARLNPRGASNTAQAQINDGASTGGTVTNSIGHFNIDRSGASARSLTKDAVSVVTDTQAASAMPNSNITILNNAASFTSRQAGLAYVGGSVGSVLVPFDAALRRLGQAVGAVT